MQGERHAAVQHAGARRRQRAELGFEERHALPQGRDEALLLGSHDAVDELSMLHDLGIGVAHELDDERGQPPQERVVHAEQTSVPHRAAQQTPEHVAAALVGGEHPVGDEEGHRARVVCEDP